MEDFVAVGAEDYQVHASDVVPELTGWHALPYTIGVWKATISRRFFMRTRPWLSYRSGTWGPSKLSE